MRLTEEQKQSYRDKGYVMPLRLFSGEEALKVRQEIEDLERNHSAGSGTHDLNRLFRINGQVAIPLLAQIAQTPELLDAVEDLIGPDLMVWSCELFIKEAGTEKIVSWHQDLTYWGLGETDDEVTAWIAFSDVSREAGCMRFIPGSHKQRILPHRDTFDEGNLLSRGQEIAVEVNEDEAVFDVLKPGEMSLHHGRLFHASGPNHSGDRRIGMAIRYISPNVEHSADHNDYAMLVRGANRNRNWINFAPARHLFGENEMRLYDEILAAQAGTLSAGAEETVNLYDVQHTTT